MALAPLPIDCVLPELIDALRRRPNAVLCAPTGSGKTTRVPPALFDAGLADSGRIIVLEPRRLAARAAARRIAFERNARVGDEIGYHVRFDKCWGRTTRLLVVTPGVLLRYLHDDPMLESAAAIIFDEFHERGLESDLALGLIRHLQREVRPELRLVAMSATLDVETVAGYLGACPVIRGEGRLHPVEIRYEPKNDSTPWPAAAARAVERLLRDMPGDILAFLPGWNEIRQSARELEEFAANNDLLIAPLHGDLPAEEQDRALLPQSRRRIVLATNVAETSVTVEGISGVVDAGLARQLRYDPAVGLDRLELGPISRASADQRAGRAGRTQPGVCIRLWSELQHRARPEQTEPEIRRVELSGAILQLIAIGERDFAAFPWFEAPSQAVIQRAISLLERLDAIHRGQLTEIGKVLARQPVAPRLGRLLIEAHRLGALHSAALAAAILTERDAFVRPAVASLPMATDSDLADRVEALQQYENSSHDRTSFGVVHRGAAHFLFRVRDQLERAVTQECGPSAIFKANKEGLLRSLMAAFPDRLARRREPGSDRAAMVGGRGVRLARSSGVTEKELFLCLDVDAGDGEGWVRQASAVRREWLPPERVTTNFEFGFDSAAERVTARRVIRFDDLILDEASAPLPDPAEVERVLMQAAVANLDRVLPAGDTPAGSLRTRVRWLRGYMPELQLPAFDDAEICELLPWLCSGRKSFAELRQADWLGLLQSKLSRQQLRALEREAPERLEVPSGSKIALRYEPGTPPVLAVRIQELFGLAETPRLAGGRVPILLHLLGPNFRPQQITDDLASFWANTYPQVRRDLRGRYPKHAWPDDPLQAVPPRRRRR